MFKLKRLMVSVMMACFAIMAVSSTCLLADESPGVPVIDAFEPNAGCCSTYVTITGQNFGQTHEGDPARDVKIRAPGCAFGDPCEVVAPIVSWTNLRIEFEVPCDEWDVPSMSGPDLRFRVENEDGNSNVEVFTLFDCSSPTDIENVDPDYGVCRTTIKLSNPGGQFGSAQTEEIDTIEGTCVTRIVDFASSQGVFTGTSIVSWSNTQVVLKFENFYEDETPHNFCQDTEPYIILCDGMGLGSYNVYIRYIFFADLNWDGMLDAGDHIYQVENSSPQLFELTNTDDMTIFKRLPAEIPRTEVLKIFGENFGPSQGDGEVRIGLYSEARQDGKTKDPYGVPYPLVLGLGDALDGYLKWTGTVIKVKMRVPWTYNNKIRWIWVEKDGKKSNQKPVKILPYAP